MDKVTRQFRLQQWAEALRDRKESGLTVKEWCKLHNVSKFQYYYRQKEVRKHAAQYLALQPVQTDKPVFVEVAQAQQSRPVRPDTNPSLSRVSACIRTGNADILVSDETSEELLVKILRAVRSC